MNSPTLGMESGADANVNACARRFAYEWPILPSYYDQAAVAWDGVQFMASINTAKRIIASRDGIHWRLYTEAINTAEVHGISASDSYTLVQESENGRFGASRAFIKESVSGNWWEVFTPEVTVKFVQNGGRIATFIPGGRIYTSTGGSDWKKVVWMKAGRIVIPDVAPAAGEGFMVLGDSAIKNEADWAANGFLFVERTAEIAKAVAIASSGREFVVVGQDGLVARSEDGKSWTRTATSRELATIDFKRVSWVGGEFVALGSCGTILESPDGITWRRFQASEPTTFYGVAEANGVFIAIGPPSFDGRGIEKFGVIYRRTEDSDWRKVVVPCKQPGHRGCDPIQ